MGIGQHFAQRVVEVVFVINHFHAHKRIVVVGHRNVVQIQFFGVLCWKILLREHLRNFAATVGAEVETQHHVALGNGGHGRAVGVGNDNGFNKFVGQTRIITFLNCIQNPFRKGSLYTFPFHLYTFPLYTFTFHLSPFSFHHRIVCFCHALPAFVAVHGKKTARYTGNLPRGLGQMLL